MTAQLREPEIPHVCVYPGMFGIGWCCTFGTVMGWAECPLEAAAEVLAQVAKDVEGGLWA
jgi:hypothetical protein